MSLNLISLAKTQLGHANYAPDTVVPKAYLDELKNHVSVYPHDTNFRIELQPQTGLGVITCLEVSCCHVRINLAPRAKVADGGKKDGLGSLSAYRAHVADHPTHKQARLTRIKAEEIRNKQGNNNVVSQAFASGSVKDTKAKRPSLLSQLDASYGSSPSNPTVRISNVSGSGVVKPEPSEGVIPRKRPLEAELPRGTVKTEAGTADPPLTPPSSKKFKAEAPKTPLALVNTNTANQVQASAPGLSLTEATAQLNEINRKLTRTQADFSKLVRKPRKTKAEMTKFGRLSKEIDRLQARKNDYAAIISSLAPVPQQIVKPEPFSMALVPSHALSHLPAQLLPASHNPASLPFGEQKPLIHQPQPVASGSNVRLPDAHLAYRDVKMDSDEDDDDDDNDKLSSDGLGLPYDPLAAMGPVAAAIGGYGENFDADGNFHGRGRDRFAGPQADADDINKFLIAAGNSEQFDGNATVDTALQKLGLKDQYQLLPGMSVALMAHQIIGVAWMIDKEKGSHMLQGGILADEMGLGKTIQMIACMVMNTSDDPIAKTNLILAPTALLDQWKLEIEMKTNIGLSCHIYHGSGKAKKKKDLLKYDVVLTTYMTLALEWPDFEAEEKAKAKKARRKKTPDFIATDSDDEPKAKKKKRQEPGLLFQVKWHRVILDEGQNIRNKRTRAARCVTDLDAKYRWCLTGTPITNSILDAYSLLRFLKIRPWYDWQYFNQYIAKYEKRSPTVATNKLQAIFATTLLRRKKDSMLDGKRLIELPDKTVELLKLEFSQEERAIYKMIEARSQATFNRFLRAGTVLKNYHQVLVLLLRLRQICSHPALIQEGEAALIAPDEMDESITPEIRDELSRARNVVGLEFVAKMKLKLKETALRRMEVEKTSVDAEVEDEECPICMDVFTDAVVTPCAHIFCRECLVNVLNGPEHPQDINDPIKYKANERPCPSCRTAVSGDKIFSRQAFEPTDTDLDPTIVKPEGDDDDDILDVSDIFEDAFRGTKGKGKAKKRSRRIVDSEDDSEGEMDSEMEDFIVHSDEDEADKDARRAEKKRSGKKRAAAKVESDYETDSGEDCNVIYGKKTRVSMPEEQVEMLPRFLPSTKMKQMMESLTSWAKDHPDEKTLIISQWTQCLQLVSDYLTENDFQHVKYQGDMNREKRDQTIRVFMAKENAQIMLMSLKCGGVGLNLTRANRVISLDLGWSEAVESQAFDRVHRLGQLRPVFVQRLVIADTVEDRVLALQDRKKGLADGALGEGTGKKIGRLSVRELANLFGLDGRGRLLAA